MKSIIRKTLVWIIVGIAGGLGGFRVFFYDSISEHVKKQDLTIQNISEQFQKNRYKRLTCSEQLKIFLSNSEAYTKNAQEILLIRKKIKEEGKITKRAQDRLSYLDVENKKIQNLNSTEKSQSIISCYQDVLNNYRQIGIELGIINANELYNPLNQTNHNTDIFSENSNETEKDYLQIIANGYFNNDNDTLDTLIQNFETTIETKRKLENLMKNNIEQYENINQNMEIIIENEISKRKNSNLFKKWTKAISIL
ncbi:hypothetical protein CYK00_06045 [Neisseria sicca]|jgi:hypothetical protein|uniref:Uncharacterized protein n=1 Tax=Neisseria sicca TaxID=490 RepID=A0A2I1XC83_NEISI|nr:hypothetical protein [Neisseria sicca]PLA40248.1 hypothetical protein CYK00_06045 [Neisseria sicca]